MSDTPIIGARPELVVPDPEKRIVSPREAARIADRNEKYDGAGKRKRPPGDFMHDMLTREEAMTHVAKAVAEATRLAMEELDDALGDRLEQMELVITENVVRALQRRTWRYRFTMWCRGILTELGIIEPVQLAKTVDPVEALDPNVQAATDKNGIEMPLQWQICPTGLPRELIPRLEAGNFIAVARKVGTSNWFMLARDTETLARAAATLGGENPSFEDGVTSALIDGVFLRRAEKLAETGGVIPDGIDAWAPTAVPTVRTSDATSVAPESAQTDAAPAVAADTESDTEGANRG